MEVDPKKRSRSPSPIPNPAQGNDENSNLKDDAQKKSKLNSGSKPLVASLSPEDPTDADPKELLILTLRSALAETNTTLQKWNEMFPNLENGDPTKKKDALQGEMTPDMLMEERKRTYQENMQLKKKLQSMELQLLEKDQIIKCLKKRLLSGAKDTSVPQTTANQSNPTTQSVPGAVSTLSGGAHSASSSTANIPQQSAQQSAASTTPSTASAMSSSLNLPLSSKVEEYNTLRAYRLDPALNSHIAQLSNKLKETIKELQECREDLEARDFTAQSITGKKLITKCKLLLEENEELGKELSEGRIMELECELASSKQRIEQMQQKLYEYMELIQASQRQIKEIS